MSPSERPTASSFSKNIKMPPFLPLPLQILHKNKLELGGVVIITE